jgi:hypothetical protein
MNTKKAVIVAITLVMAVAALTVLYAAPVPVAAAPLQYSGPNRAYAVECYAKDNTSPWDYTDLWYANQPPGYFSYNPNDYPCGVVSYNGRTAPFNSSTRTVSWCYASDSPPFSSKEMTASIVLSSSCSTYTAEVNISSWPRTTDAGAPFPGYYTLRGAEGWGLIWQTAAGQTGPAYNVQYATDCDGLVWNYSQDFGFYC